LLFLIVKYLKKKPFGKQLVTDQVATNFCQSISW
jgi:hypothetical protein